MITIPKTDEIQVFTFLIIGERIILSLDRKTLKVACNSLFNIKIERGHQEKTPNRIST